MENVNLSSLVTPAILVALIGYLTRFFGKAINDQAPFSDDETWSAELKGIIYIVEVSFGLLGVYFATSKPWASWWMHIVTGIILLLIFTLLYFSNKYLSVKYFDIGKKDLNKLEESTNGFIKFFADSHQYINVSLISLVLFYFITLEYLSKNLYFILFFFPVVFWIFLNLAFNSSIKLSEKNKRVPVDILFKDSTRTTLKQVIVLKYNKDNIRVRTDEKIIFLNKSEVFSVEMIIPENSL